MGRIFVSAAAGIALVAGAAMAAPGEHGGDKAAHGKSDGGPEGGGKAERNANSRGETDSKAQSFDKRNDARPARAEARQEKRQESRAAMHSPARSQDRRFDQRGRDERGGGERHASLATENRSSRERADETENRFRDERPNDNSRRKDADSNLGSGPGRIADVSRPPERKDLKRMTYKDPRGREFMVPANDRVRVITERRGFDWASLDRRNRYDGCPPGLARKYNGCTPPGLDRQAAAGWARPEWYFRDYDRAYRYRYLDGYMLRLGSGDSVLSYVPLLGGALAVGQVWPASYQPVTLPTYYDAYYELGPADSYRYYDDTIYRVDPGTSAINSVIALLTGNDIAVGQPMPAGYEVYNVPYGYRDQYYDGPDALYRYSDGYIYQLDPATRLVQAAIELLA